MTTDVQKSVTRARRLTLQLKSGDAAVGQGATAFGDPATGLVRSGPSATYLSLGVFNTKADPTAAQVACDVDFLQEVTILFRANDGGITAADIFKPCYHADDRTVTKTSSAHTLAGTILIVDAVDGVGYAVGRPFLENT